STAGPSIGSSTSLISAGWSTGRSGTMSGSGRPRKARRWLAPPGGTTEPNQRAEGHLGVPWGGGLMDGGLLTLPGTMGRPAAALSPFQEMLQAHLGGLELFWAMVFAAGCALALWRAVLGPWWAKRRAR